MSVCVETTKKEEKFLTSRFPSLRMYVALNQTPTIWEMLQVILQYGFWSSPRIVSKSMLGFNSTETDKNKT